MTSDNETVTATPERGQVGAHTPMRMAAYYYAFDPTGVRHIDVVLSAVACAGKAYHHTEDWRDNCSPYPHLTGANPVEWIQNAATDAAASHAEAIRLISFLVNHSNARALLSDGFLEDARDWLKAAKGVA